MDLKNSAEEHAKNVRKSAELNTTLNEQNSVISAIAVFIVDGIMRASSLI